MFEMPTDSKLKLSDFPNMPQTDSQIEILRQHGVVFGNYHRDPFLDAAGQCELPENLARDAVRKGVRVKDL